MSETDQEECACSLEDLVRELVAVKRFSELDRDRLEQLAQNDIETMKKSRADNELHESAVPVTDCGPEDYKSEVSRNLLALLLAEELLGNIADLNEYGGAEHRIEQIVTKPSAQSDVPALPVLADRVGKERAVEILGHLDTEKV